MPPRTLTRAAAIAMTLLLGVTAQGCSHGNAKAFCQKVRLVPEFSSVFGTFDPADPSAAKAAFAHAAATLHDLEQVSPSAIRGDVAKIAEVADKLAAALADVNDPAAATARLNAIATQLAAIGPASLHVTSYAKQHCGVDLSTPSTAGSTSSTTAPSSTTG